MGAKGEICASLALGSLVSQLWSLKLNGLLVRPRARFLMARLCHSMANKHSIERCWHEKKKKRTKKPARSELLLQLEVWGPDEANSATANRLDLVLGAHSWLAAKLARSGSLSLARRNQLTQRLSHSSELGSTPCLSAHSSCGTVWRPCIVLLLMLRVQSTMHKGGKANLL